MELLDGGLESALAQGCKWSFLQWWDISWFS